MCSSAPTIARSKVSIHLANCLPDTFSQASVKFYPVAAAACFDLEGKQVTDPAAGYTWPVNYK